MLLTDNRAVAIKDVVFDSDTQRFYLAETGEDITFKIYRKDKVLFTGFDSVKTNELYYREAHPDAPPPGETNVTKIFLGQLVTDPLAAPADVLNSGVESLKKTLSSPVAWVVILGGAIGLLFLLRKNL